MILNNTLAVLPGIHCFITGSIFIVFQIDLKQRHTTSYMQDNQVTLQKKLFKINISISFKKRSFTW
jgi:hypothetical protein